jgi:hypothetical protein
LRAVVGIVAVLAIVRPCSAADEATLLDETGSGVVPVNGETGLRVRALEGEIILQRGPAGEVEFRSTTPDAEGAEVSVALWTDGEAFRIEPPKGRQSIRARLILSIPPGMRVRLDVEKSAIRASGIESDLAVFGRQLSVDAQGLPRSVLCEIEGGSVNIQSVARAVTVRGRDLDVLLSAISGRAELRLTGGTAKLTGLGSGVLGDFTGTSVGIDTVSDAVSLRFLKGTAEVARLQDGGDIVLAGCQLRLEQVAGALSVTSDSAVRFDNCRASLHIENSAGPVTGVKNDGTLDVTTHNAQVALAQIQGQLRITGDNLAVKLEQIAAIVGVLTRMSGVALDVATAAVTVETDGGDVTISRTDAQVDVKTRGGNVYMTHLRGPITVESDGELVDVAWDVLSSAADSRITNEGGDVTVRFPPAGDSRIDVVSRINRIENGLPNVLVAEDGGSAQGVAVSKSGQDLKTLYVKASGEVRLLGSDAADQSGQAP